LVSVFAELELVDELAGDGALLDDTAELAAEATELVTLEVADDVAELTTLLTTLDVTWFCVTWLDCTEHGEAFL
jgi:hypothetical protein